MKKNAFFLIASTFPVNALRKTSHGKRGAFVKSLCATITLGTFFVLVCANGPQCAIVGLVSGSVLRAHRLLSESACCPNPHAQQGVSLFFSCLMKYLDAETLNLLDRTWSDWLEKARTLKQRRIRLRLYFVYLLIRHGGLRLGEALEIDDKKLTLHGLKQFYTRIEEVAIRGHDDL